jgi:hypothetical protein
LITPGFTLGSLFVALFADGSAAYGARGTTNNSATSAPNGAPNYGTTGTTYNCTSSFTGAAIRE